MWTPGVKGWDVRPAAPLMGWWNEGSEGSFCDIFGEEDWCFGTYCEDQLVAEEKCLCFEGVECAIYAQSKD